MKAEWLLKIAEVAKKVKDFEDAYMSPKSVFTLMRKTGVMSEEEVIDINNRYDLAMAPYVKKSEELQAKAYGKVRDFVVPLFTRKDK